MTLAEAPGSYFSTGKHQVHNLLAMLTDAGLCPGAP